MKNRIKNTLPFLALLLVAGCSKHASLTEQNPLPSVSSYFTSYTIQQGNHYADQSSYRARSLNRMSFDVRFDSSAIYRSRTAENQYDINKLYGFADNGADHHRYSARFGWRWSGGALRLFAYVYNEGAVEAKEITTATIGDTLHCAIEAQGTTYLFTVNDTMITMPRLSQTAKAEGYQLYPYFGGDETAPHLVRIWIREEGGM